MCISFGNASFLLERFLLQAFQITPCFAVGLKLHPPQ